MQGERAGLVAQGVTPAAEGLLNGIVAQGLGQVFCEHVRAALWRAGGKAAKARRAVGFEILAAFLVSDEHPFPLELIEPHGDGGVRALASAKDQLGGGSDISGRVGQLGDQPSGPWLELALLPEMLNALYRVRSKRPVQRVQATGVDETKRGPRKRVTAFLVDIGMRGFECREGNKCVSYRGYKNFQLSFDNVRLGPEQVLGEEARGLELAGKWLGMGRIWVGATCCGKAERLMEMATDWAANRKQFGKPIGSFQATGFRLAGMAIGLRAADLLVADAVQRADAGQLEDADAAMVKVFCSEMLNKVADDTVQIYGGMGLMEEMPIHRLWRDSRLERIWDGTSEIQRHIITRSILRPLGA